MTARRALPFLICSISLAAQPSGFSSLAARAAAARQSDRVDEAIALYRKAVALRPAWEEGWWYLGTLLYDKSSYPEAADAFRKNTTLNPKAGNAFAMLGLCEFELSREANALRHLDAADRLGIAGDDRLRNVVQYHRAVLLQRKGEFESAIEIQHSLCLAGADTPELEATLGLAALRARATAPHEAMVARVGRAECLAGAKKFDDARREYAAAVAADPAWPEIHYAYGCFLVDAGDPAAAVEQFREEIRRHPNHTAARLRIAAAYYKADSAAGLPFAEEAVRLDPGVPLGHYLLGLLLLDTDDYRRAIPELETARRSFPNEAKLYLALGAAYARAGRDQDAARARNEYRRITAR